MIKKIQYFAQTYWFEALFSLGLVCSFIRGFRGARIWTIMHALPTFKAGYYRRGALGTVYSLLPEGYRYNYYVWMVVAFFLLAMLIACLFFFSRQHRYAKLYCALFFLGCFGAYLFHEVGYLEQILVLLLLLAVALLKNGHINTAIGIMVLSVFVHELALFFTVPIFFCVLFSNHASIKRCVMLALPILLAGIFVKCFDTLPQGTIEATIEHVERHAQFDQHFPFWDIYSRKIEPVDGTYFPPSFAWALYATILQACLLGAAFYSSKRPLKSSLLVAVVVITGFLPLYLARFGWDIERWLFLCCLSQLLILCLVHRYLENMHALKIMLLIFLSYSYFHVPRFFSPYQIRSLSDSRSVKRFFTQDIVNELTTIPTR